MAGSADISELADMASFELLLSRELSANRRAGTRLAVLLVDFEAVLVSAADADADDHLNKLTQLLGQRLRARVRSSDAVMRIGAQRFAVLLQNVGRADVHPIQTRLYDGLAAAYQLGWPLQSVQLFMGLAKYVDVSSTAAELIAAAELTSGRSVVKTDWQKVQAPQVQDVHPSPRSLN
ncbi:diguanylate cyclase domain-containing protein [Roseateles sp. GG27B]